MSEQVYHIISTYFTIKKRSHVTRPAVHPSISLSPSLCLLYSAFYNAFLQVALLSFFILLVFFIEIDEAKLVISSA